MKLAKYRQAQGISITTIIIALLALIVLVVLVAIFVRRLGLFGEEAEEIGEVEQYIGLGDAPKGQPCEYRKDDNFIGGTCRTRKECDEEGGAAGSTSGVKKENSCAIGLVCCTQ